MGTIPAISRVNGKIKNATISQLAGQWYISFQVEVETAEPNHTSTTIVGLDAGVTKLATLSDGTVYHQSTVLKQVSASWQHSSDS